MCSSILSVNGWKFPRRLVESTLHSDTLLKFSVLARPASASWVNRDVSVTATAQQRITALTHVWLGGRAVREPDLRSTGRRFQSRPPRCQVQPWASCLQTRSSVSKQYNLVPANGRWCSVAGEVTVGLAESNGSLPPGLWLQSLAGWLPRTRINYETLCSFRVWDYLKTQTLSRDTKALVTLWFYFNLIVIWPPFDSHSTAVRPSNDHGALQRK